MFDLSPEDLHSSISRSNLQFSTGDVSRTNPRVQRTRLFLERWMERNFAWFRHEDEVRVDGERDSCPRPAGAFSREVPALSIGPDRRNSSFGLRQASTHSCFDAMVRWRLRVESLGHSNAASLLVGCLPSIHVFRKPRLFASFTGVC